jgi:hypothetical protein
MLECMTSRTRVGIRSRFIALPDAERTARRLAEAATSSLLPFEEKAVEQCLAAGRWATAMAYCLQTAAREHVPVPGRLVREALTLLDHCSLNDDIVRATRNYCRKHLLAA